MIGLSEQEQQRRESMQELMRLGIDPFPAATFEINATAKKAISPTFCTCSLTTSQYYLYKIRLKTLTDSSPANALACHATIAPLVQSASALT
jgi:hypothetical protein